MIAEGCESERGSKENSGSCSLDPLVRQVSRALKKTKRMMFWDIVPDEDDIRDRLVGYLKDSYTATEAVESVIEGMLHSHQETLCNAARDQCNCATKAALASLPNDQGHQSQPGASVATKKGNESHGN
jgi:hypothetical protein